MKRVMLSIALLAVLAVVTAQAVEDEPVDRLEYLQLKQQSMQQAYLYHQAMVELSRMGAENLGAEIEQLLIQRAAKKAEESKDEIGDAIEQLEEKSKGGR